MDRKLPPEVIRKARIKRYGILAGTVIIVGGGFLFLRAAISPTLDRSRILTSVAEIGPIEETIAASGVVVPEFEQVLTSPVATTVAYVRAHSGDSVKAGESILQLDTSAIQIRYKQTADELEIQKNKKRQLKLKLDREKADLQAQYDIKNLQVQYAKSKFDRVTQLQSIGGATQSDLDLSSLNLEIARRELAQLEQQIRNQKESIEAEVQEVELQISVEQNRLNEIQRSLDLSTARAGMDGILTWVNEGIGSAVSAGDEIARVADLSSFKVEARISDIHAGKLEPGGRVIVRIGDTTLRGAIGAVRPSVDNGIVTFVVELSERNHPVLRPNQRADIYVVTSFKDNVLRVKNGPFHKAATIQEVFVVKGDRAIRHTVDIGVSNFDWVELQGDIEAGDEVIVSDMERYRHMDEISIRSKTENSR
jgi:HlyD family secretion protein